VRALQKARQQVEARDLAAARAATVAAEQKAMGAERALARAHGSRSAHREMRDERYTSLAADMHSLEEEVVALRAEEAWLTLLVGQLRRQDIGGLKELEGRLYSLASVLPSGREGLRLALRDTIVHLYVRYGVAMYKTLPAVNSCWSNSVSRCWTTSWIASSSRRGRSSSWLKWSGWTWRTS
jgi:hypothetical protein